MRYIKIKDLQTGMILAQPLLNKRGDVFLARNISVSRFMVQRIREEQYRGAYVYDKLSKGINPKNQLPADVQLKAMCALKDMDIDRCAYLSGEILDSLKHADNISMNINSLAAYDSPTYTHSLNVAMYAGTALLSEHCCHNSHILSYPVLSDTGLPCKTYGCTPF